MFNGFQLFSDVGKYTNPESIAGSVGVGDISSFGNVSAGQIFGLASGFTGLSSNGQRRKPNHGWIVDTVTRDKLAFQYNVDIRETGGVNYGVQQTLARSIPQLHYKGGKQRTLAMPIVFTAEEKSKNDVLRAVRWLQALAYPDYNEEGELNQAPHPVVIVQGEIYATDVWAVTDFNVEWGVARDAPTMLPFSTTVNLTLVEMAISKSKSQQEVLHL